MKRLRMLLNSVNNGVTIVNYRSTKTFQYRHFTMDGKQKDNAGDKPLQEASKGKSDQKSNITSTINYAGDTYGEFERTVMERLNESNSRRFRVILTTTVLVIFWVVIVFGARIRKMLTQHTADLAKETLEDESLKIQTQELARAVVQTVLNDKEIAAQAATFLKDASTAPETQQALLKLTIHVLQHPDSLAELTEMIKKIIDHLSTDKVRDFNCENNSFMNTSSNLTGNHQATRRFVG